MGIIAQAFRFVKWGEGEEYGENPGLGGGIFSMDIVNNGRM